MAAGILDGAHNIAKAGECQSLQVGALQISGFPDAKGVLSSLLDDRLGCDYFMNGSHFLDQLIVLFQSEGLSAIGQGLIRLIVNFYD